MREFHTFSKIKAHLYHSEACRTWLLSRNVRYKPTSGPGSIVDDQLARAHDRMLPPLPAEGPRPADHGLREFHDIDDQLYICLVDHFCDAADEFDQEHCIVAVLEDFFSTHAISWTKTNNTLNFFIDTLSEQGGSWPF